MNIINHNTLNNHNESDNSLKTYGLDLGNVSSKNIREACSLTRK